MTKGSKPNGVVGIRHLIIPSAFVIGDSSLTSRDSSTWPVLSKVEGFRMKNSYGSCLSSAFQRAHASSRAFLSPSRTFGFAGSPERMKP
jgi:hypothetical protein